MYAIQLYLINAPAHTIEVENKPQTFTATSTMPSKVVAIAKPLLYPQLTGTLRDIAKCESGIRQYNDDGSVVRGRANPKDVGLLQINEFYHLAASKKLGFNIYTTEGNIAYGKWLYAHEGAKPWSWSAWCHKHY